MLKKNLTALAVLFALICFSNISNAQIEDRSAKTPEEKATRMADRMKQNLSLTDEQYKQVYSIFLTKIQERQNNKEKYKSMDEATRQQMRSQHKEEMRKQFESILTQDQLAKMNEMKEKRKMNKGKHKGEKNKLK